MIKKRLAVVVTHPIQYYAPVFKQLTERGNIHLKVFYTWGEDSIKPKYDPGFGKVIEWDIPLLNGYHYQFLKNTSDNPGSSHFKGIVNPDAIDSIKRFDPDAILVYGWSYYSHLRIIRYFSGKVPIWFRGDSTLLDEQAPGIKNLIKSLLLKWLYSHVDKVFFVGTANKEYFLKYGVKPENLIFAPHAIDNERFGKDRLAEAFELREQLKISDQDTLVLFAGKFEPKKNPDLLLRAFIELDFPNSALVLVGDGKLENKLISMIASRANIHLLPFQNQQYMPVVYQACDIFCLPSRGPGETWGLAVNEAMAAGKAILTSDRVGCSTDLINNENGFVFTSDNINDIKEKLLMLLQAGKNRERGTVSRKIISEWSFDEQIIAFENEFYK